MESQAGPPLEFTFNRNARRLDAALASLMEDRGVSRSRIRRWIEEGRVLLNGRPAKPSGPVSQGDVALVRQPPEPPVEPRPQDLPVRTIFEDEACLVVEKPAGMVTHPAKGHQDGTLVNALLGAGYGLSKVSGPERPGILHRLDKETSGLLVVGKTDAAHLALARQFADRTVKKTYLALAWGSLPEDELEVDRPIGRDPHHRTRMAVIATGRAALTRFRMVERLLHISLVEARPETGRTHQIRVHLSHIHHPVVGDGVYGGRRSAGLPSKALRDALRTHKRFFLHAHRLEFESPAGSRVVAESPLPTEFQTVMEVFRSHE
jgi:23S rRNA pseudouridine1911/1915/1917 synthase